MLVSIIGTAMLVGSIGMMTVSAEVNNEYGVLVYDVNERAEEDILITNKNNPGVYSGYALKEANEAVTIRYETTTGGTGNVYGVIITKAQVDYTKTYRLVLDMKGKYTGSDTKETNGVYVGVTNMDADGNKIGGKNVNYNIAKTFDSEEYTTIVKELTFLDGTVQASFTLFLRDCSNANDYVDISNIRLYEVPVEQPSEPDGSEPGGSEPGGSEPDDSETVSGTFGVTSEIVDGKVKMTVKAYNIKSVASAQLGVSYDAAVLEYESYEMGAGASENSYVSVGEKETGVATVAYIDADAADAGEEGTVLAILTFGVKAGVAATTTDVELTLEELYGEATNDATLNRADAANADVRATYGDPTDIADLVPAETVKVALPGVGDDVLMGDVTGNGEIDPLDATTILQFIVGSTTLTDAQKVVADVTGNGEIDPLDATAILQDIVG